MSLCKKCRKEIVDGAPFCPWCGAKLIREKTRRRRPNGSGTVIKQKNGRYKAIKTLGYHPGEDGKLKRETATRTFDTSKEAWDALPTLSRRKEKTVYTFKALYDKWLPTHKAGASTIGCYTAAYAYFSPLWYAPMPDIEIDDLQECIDDCPKGKRTKQNMKALCSLMYKYGIPRHATGDNLNLAQYLIINDDGTAPAKPSFSREQIELIAGGVGRVDYADYVLSLIYTGFRPGEFVSLTAASYHANHGDAYLVGGFKTEAGKDRTVTISPKVYSIIAAQAKGKAATAPLFDMNGKAITRDKFTDIFYDVLEAVGIDNPTYEQSDGTQRHKYTPHCCRHTFATLIKSVAAPSVDKMRLIGHASEHQMNDYTDTPLSDLSRITSQI